MWVRERRALLIIIYNHLNNIAIRVRGGRLKVKTEQEC